MQAVLEKLMMKAGQKKNWGKEKYNHKIICGRIMRGGSVGGSGEVDDEGWSKEELGQEKYNHKIICRRIMRVGSVGGSGEVEGIDEEGWSK